MKVALVHDWLTGMRGGERVLEVLCELFPDADIYTLLHVDGSVSPTIERHRIHSTFIRRLPQAKTKYRFYLILFPFAAERIDLSGYDLILSSSHCVAKNVRVPEGACHISYVHTPMRYVWDQFDAYFGPGRANLPVRVAMRAVRPWLQKRDVETSRRVNHFIANSRHVARRIERHYGREAEVIYPPVDVDRFSPSARDEGYYLMVTAFAPYKRVDLAIEAFNRTGLPLRIIGSGQDGARLRSMAGRNIEFIGWGTDAEVSEAYAGCKALIFPGEEDFGIVPVEAMASGKPVIAYGRGGVLDTVVPLDGHGSLNGASSNSRAPTGIFFQEQSPDSLIQALRRFEANRHRFDSERMARHARSFHRSSFKERLQEFVREKYDRFQNPV
jgi:glycosyltransferase involved in cell wall biosynthesis